MSLIVDQQQMINDGSAAGAGQFASARYRGQVFTPTQARVDAVMFYCQFDGGGTIGFKIYFYNVDQGTNLPTTEIYSFTVAASAYTQNKYNRFTLPVPITGLTPGTKYCFYVAPWDIANDQYPAGDYYRDLKWSATAGDYTGGPGLLNNNGSWSTQTLRMFFQLFYEKASPVFTPNYAQPNLPARTKGWAINSIDLQIVTKSQAWNQDQTKRLNEYQAVKNLGPNYIALAVPYDNPTKYANYIADARTKGFSVYHRSHPFAWEGDNSFKPYIGRQEYLDMAYNFIISHPTLFADGDLFGMTVEPTNANDNGNYTFRTPETSGGTFTYSKFNQFQKDCVAYANEAFRVIGKSVATFPLSTTLSCLNLNGQVLDSGDGGNSNGLGNADIVQYFGGILAIDHYMDNSYRSTTPYGTRYASDLDKIHAAFPDCKIMIGEIGFPVASSLSDQEQYNTFKQIIEALQARSYIIGVNFWVHMASNTASIFGDSGGTIAPEGRLARQAIKGAFEQGNATFGRPLSGARTVR